MKQRVWKNKSNGQLCLTIPKGSAIKEGDYLELQKTRIKRIAYSGVVGDLFHYGHLHSIQFAKSISDYNIVGVISDTGVEAYRVKPIADYQERKAIIEDLKSVDRVMLQRQRDPTENLKLIHEQFPEAEIILVHGDDLEEVHGAEFVQQINGRVVKHPYYARLSTFKIINELLERKGKFKDTAEFTSFFQQTAKVISENRNKIIISSKADTLKALSPLLKRSKIEPLFSFTISDWKNNKLNICAQIKTQFSPAKIVVRSSSVNEDTLEKSMAGCFESVLHIDSSNHQEIEKAVNKVAHSYRKKSAESSFNQILVQKQTDNIIMSGVVFTRTLEQHGPYYVINYDDTTGCTDSVTSGKEPQTMHIFRFSSEIPPNMKEVISSVQEIEDTIPGLPLDIEFALTENKDNQEKEVVIFQVRPLSANLHKNCDDQEVKNKVQELKDKFKDLAHPKTHLSGNTTFFGDMPDWNPAEIIGDSPHHLDYSLYDYLITHSAWHEARTSQGYYNVNPAQLVELFGNKPYVDVRNTFNSFIPAKIARPLREKLMSFYLEKLRDNPPLQDKVEFEVLYTCFDLTFAERSRELIDSGFSLEEVAELKNNLLELTNKLILNSVQSIEKDMAEVLSLEEFRSFIKKNRSEVYSPSELIHQAKLLLEEGRKKGTVQFSRLARLGFVGKTILKSLVKRGGVNQDFYDRFYKSISTVATKINEDFKKLLREEITKENFLQEYGHLRPGTYDITSPCYQSYPQLLDLANFTAQENERESIEKRSFQLDPEISSIITKVLQQEGLQLKAEQFLSFVEKATQARELSKFEFTKNLSEALELLAQAGEKMGFTRKELALLDINYIFKLNQEKDAHKLTAGWKELIKKKEQERAVQEKLILPPLIFSESDLEIIQPYSAKPNFITQKLIEANAVNINTIKDQPASSLEGSIIIMENGDPGYDWIFTRNIAGLITKYGGVASHMSIRCAEFGIPAAIGCGELIFNQVKNAEKVLLNCKENKIIAGNKLIPAGEWKHR